MGTSQSLGPPRRLNPNAAKHKTAAGHFSLTIKRLSVMNNGQMIALYILAAVFVVALFCKIFGPSKYDDYE